MLSEEEKKAIKECKRLSKEDYYGDSYFAEKHSIQILLNLLEKKQQEIENLKDKYIPKKVIKDKIKEYKHKHFISMQVVMKHDEDALKIVNVLEKILGDE